MSTKIPMQFEAFSEPNAPEGPHEDSHESAHSKFDSAHENVHQSVLGQFSYVLFSHVLFLAQKGPLLLSHPGRLAFHNGMGGQIATHNSLYQNSAQRLK